MPVVYWGCNTATLSDIHILAEQHLWAKKLFLLMIWNDLLQEFIDITAIVSFCKDFVRCSSGMDILNTLLKYWVTYRQLTFSTETFKLMMKSYAKFDLFFMGIFHTSLYVHLKNWSLNFKLLYLLNHISYFNNICRICCVYTQIQIRKV